MAITIDSISYPSAPPARNMKHFKIILFIFTYVAGLVALATLGYLYADYKIGTDTNKIVKSEKSSRFHTDVTYVDLPPMNLTISSGESNASGRVRMNITLEVDKKYASKIEGYVPRITDRIVAYSRQLDYEEIKRPSAAITLRQRFLQITNSITEPTPIIDVIFRQFIIL